LGDQGFDPFLVSLYQDSGQVSVKDFKLIVVGFGKGKYGCQLMYSFVNALFAANFDHLCANFFVFFDVVAVHSSCWGFLGHSCCLFEKLVNGKAET